MIGLQVGDTKYKVFSAKDTNGFVEKNELALYYHGIPATFHRNDGTDDPIYVQICYYSKTKEIYDFGSLMDDIVNSQQGKHLSVIAFAHIPVVKENLQHL